jgi:hypothetical protein
MYLLDFDYENEVGGMKRLRESGPCDDPLSDNKRRRRAEETNLPEEEKEAEGVLHRCLTWIMSIDPQNRPKSLPSLKNGLRDLCSLTYTVDHQVVFHHLMLNGIIWVENNRVFFTQKDNQGAFQIFVPNDPHLQAGIDTRISTDFSQALSKAAHWIRNNRGFSQGATVPLESFLHSLAQICLFKRKIQPEYVVEHLCVKGLVVCHPNGSLVYNLPTEFLRPGHYMAFASN